MEEAPRDHECDEEQAPARRISSGKDLRLTDVVGEPQPLGIRLQRPEQQEQEERDAEKEDASARCPSHLLLVGSLNSLEEPPESFWVVMHLNKEYGFWLPLALEPAPRKCNGPLARNAMFENKLKAHMTNRNQGLTQRGSRHSGADDRMTEEQHTYLRTLCQECGETFPNNLTRKQATEMISDLQVRTGRPLD